MNQLPAEKKQAIRTRLATGTSIRSTAKFESVAENTVRRLARLPVIELDVCKCCHQPLTRLDWNERVYLLVCANWQCQLHHRPQGLEKRDIPTIPIMAGTSVYQLRQEAKKTLEVKYGRVVPVSR